MPTDQGEDDAYALVFESPSLADDLVLFGTPAITLDIERAERQAQVAVRLCDVAPDGTAMLITRAVRNLALDEDLDAAGPDRLPSPGLRLDLGGLSVTPTAVTATTVSFAMPPGVPCDTTLMVTNLDNQSAASPFNDTPQVVNTLLASGPAAGGQSFFVVGSGLDTVTATIAGTPATVSSQTPTVLTLIVPPGSPGTVPVLITNPAGCSTTTTYTYL